MHDYEVGLLPGHRRPLEFAGFDPEERMHRHQGVQGYPELREATPSSSEVTRIQHDGTWWNDADWDRRSYPERFERGFCRVAERGRRLGRRDSGRRQQQYRRGFRRKLE